MSNLNRPSGPRENDFGKWKSGFTLIELLVVIAVIAIISAILFPVFAQVREKARAATCVSNERQMGLALIQYADDYDDTVPPAQTQDNDPTGIVLHYWFTSFDTRSFGGFIVSGGLIQPYLKSKDVVVCPDGALIPGLPTCSPYAVNYDFLTPVVVVNGVNEWDCA